MSQENIKIVQQAYSDFKNGNIEGILNSLTEDIEWELPSIPKVPFSGKRTGRTRVGQFFVTLAECQDNLSFEPREFVADGEKVVSLGNYRWRVKSTGKTYECAFAHVFTIRNGKVTKFLEYTDTAAAASAYQS